jgi:hypothetical protein
MVAVVAVVTACSSSGGKGTGAGATGSAKTAGGGSTVGGSTVGVTDTTITLSVVGGYSGPAAAIHEQQSKVVDTRW